MRSVLCTRTKILKQVDWVLALQAPSCEAESGDSVSGPLFVLNSDFVHATTAVTN